MIQYPHCNVNITVNVIHCNPIGTEKGAEVIVSILDALSFAHLLRWFNHTIDP
jgi:hypothetical protein